MKMASYWAPIQGRGSDRRHLLPVSMDGGKASLKDQGVTCAVVNSSVVTSQYKKFLPKREVLF